jgi:hypothetical protein
LDRDSLAFIQTYTLHVHTAGAPAVWRKGIDPERPYSTSGGGKGYTLHVYTAGPGGGKEYTLYTLVMHSSYSWRTDWYITSSEIITGWLKIFGRFSTENTYRD